MAPEHSQPSKDSEATDAKPAALQAKTMRAKDVLAYAAIFATLIGCFYYVATFGDDVKATIECPTIHGGYNCQVSLVSGTPPAISVCWEINSVCSNGIRLSERKCFKGHLEKGTPVHLLIATSDIKNYDQCDHISATSVEKVELGISNGIVTKGAFQ